MGKTLHPYATGRQAKDDVGATPSHSSPELPAPIAHRFVPQRDPVFRHQRFAIPVAQAEAEVQLDTVRMISVGNRGRLYGFIIVRVFMP
jgi:hypothetical protein